MANNFPNLKPALSLDMVNGVYVDPRVTFSRAGTRTYFGREVVKAEENLLLHSNDATQTAWVKDRVAATGANTLVETIDNQSHLFRQLASVVSGQSYTKTISMQKGVLANAPDFMQLFMGDGGFGATQFATVNVLTGDVVNTAGGAICTALGADPNVSGAWRFSYTATATATTSTTGLGVAFCDNNSAAARTPAYIGSTTADCKVYRMQCENRSAATAYTPTTTQPITRYQRQLKTAAANEWPREFDPVTGECLGRSVWESRTNRCLHSEDFGNAAWVKTDVTVATNQTIAPDGTLTADQLTASAGNGTVIQDLGAVASAAKTGALYLKRYTGTGAIEITLNGGSSWTAVTLTNTWTRFNLTATLADEDFGIRIVTSGDSVFAWGGMVETGGFMTPYIPTVASQVTRLADSAVMTGVNFSSWFNPSEGALVLEGAAAGSSGALITIAEGALATNRILITLPTPSISGNILFAAANGLTQASLSGTPTTSTANKVAGSYAVNDYKVCLNGGTVGTDTVALVPVVDNLRLGQTVGTTFSGYYRRVTYYNQALTAANLQAVTR
jgi:hypothetical protein